MLSVRAERQEYPLAGGILALRSALKMLAGLRERVPSKQCFG